MTHKYTGDLLCARDAALAHPDKQVVRATRKKAPPPGVRRVSSTKKAAQLLEPLFCKMFSV